MSESLYEIPERIDNCEFKYLNCRVGGNTSPESVDDELVLDKIEQTLSENFVQIYYKYPETGPSDQEYIDIVVLSKPVGCAVVNTVQLSIEQIESKTGPDWNIEGQSQSIRPESVSGDAAVAIRNQFESRPELRDRARQSRIPVQDFVALTKISREEWEDKFGDPSQRLIFRDDLTDRDKIQDALMPTEDANVSDEELRHALATLKFSENISGGQLNTAIKPKSKRDLLDFLNRRLKIITDKQLKIGLQAPDAPQQIRGIAGSGKTVVCALRAAMLHKRNPEWKIAVTFRTHGLQQTHEDLISKFYKTFSNGDEPDWDQLHIRHGWGGKYTGPGMYSELAADCDNVKVRSSQDARMKWGRYQKVPTLLNKCCKEVYDSDNIPQKYNAIIVDEAQDLTPYFFRMCYEALTDTKRIYWAYDEAQNLASLEAQSSEDLFGRNEAGEPLVDVSKKLEGGINGTHVMRNAFRTPRSVLMTAHAFGMGLYRDGPVIQTITNQDGWHRLGYSIEEGNFKQSNVGESVKIRRPIENSPHPFMEYQDPDELINLYWGDTWDDEVEWVVDDVEENIKNEDVLPNEIIITHLWPYKIRSERLEKLKSELNERLGDAGTNDESVVNHVTESVSKRGSNADFKEDGKITISEVHHARGNEAGLVYVMGVDHVAEEASLKQYSESSWRRKHVESRNQAFVALSRTQGWCRVTGTDPTNRIAGELNRILHDTQVDEPKLEFEVPPRDRPFKELEPGPTLEGFDN